MGEGELRKLKSRPRCTRRGARGHLRPLAGGSVWRSPACALLEAVGRLSRGDDQCASPSDLARQEGGRSRRKPGGCVLWLALLCSYRPLASVIPAQACRPGPITEAVIIRPEYAAPIWPRLESPEDARSVLTGSVRSLMPKRITQASGPPGLMADSALFLLPDIGVQSRWGRMNALDAVSGACETSSREGRAAERIGGSVFVSLWTACYPAYLGSARTGLAVNRPRWEDRGQYQLMR